MDPIDHEHLHRTAKLFMDDGSARSAGEAMERLRGFGLTVVVGADAARSRAAHVALLTLVNAARRTLLGGVEVVGCPDAPCLALHPGATLAAAVEALGGRLADAARPDWPVAAIGADAPAGGGPAWRLAWDGWRGGALPRGDGRRLSDDPDAALGPFAAAAACAAEAFAHHAGGSGGRAGRRASGLSLWRPGGDWLDAAGAGPAICYLPSRLWLIGLGNLGQALCWILAGLPYPEPTAASLVLQDDDRMAPSNDSTSLLSWPGSLGERKVRAVGRWMEGRGFETALVERRFGPWTRVGPDDPAAAFCGVDNALARSQLEDAGFGLVVEAGLGGGPQAFRSLSMHAFPGSRAARDVWASAEEEAGGPAPLAPAYEALAAQGMDGCGLAQLASRTVGVPFVGLLAATVAAGELMRRLHGGPALELVSGSMLSLRDVAAVAAGDGPPFAFGHVLAARPAMVTAG